MSTCKSLLCAIEPSKDTFVRSCHSRHVYMQKGKAQSAEQHPQDISLYAFNCTNFFYTVPLQNIPTQVHQLIPKCQLHLCSTSFTANQIATTRSSSTNSFLHIAYRPSLSTCSRVLPFTSLGSWKIIGQELSTTSPGPNTASGRLWAQAPMVSSEKPTRPAARSRSRSS